MGQSIWTPETGLVRYYYGYITLWNRSKLRNSCDGEGEDVAEHLVADFDNDGNVVGFTLEHAGEMLKADFLELGRLSGGDVEDVPNTNGTTALEKLKSVRSRVISKQKANTLFQFAKEGILSSL